MTELCACALFSLPPLVCVCSLLHPRLSPPTSKKYLQTLISDVVGFFSLVKIDVLVRFAVAHVTLRILQSSVDGICDSSTCYKL